MQENEILELTGTVEAVIYRNDENGYTVIELSGDKEITAVGIMPELNPGEEVRLMGSFKPHPNYGMQFSATACEKSMPSDIAGILKYLSSGAVKGIGPATAALIVKEFGAASLEVMENEPYRVSKLRGISKEKALSFSEQLKLNVGIKELMLHLSKYDISPATAIKIYKFYGNNAVDAVENNPFALVEGDFNVSFETADRIAKIQGRPLDEKVRVRAGITYVLSHNRNNGHTCLPSDRLLKTACSYLKVEMLHCEAALRELVEDNTLISCEIEGKDYIFLKELYESEYYIATRLKMMMMFPAVQLPDIDKQIEAIEKVRNIEYAERQKEAITQALSKGLLILTGGPGTGKTTTLNAIIKLLKNKGQKVLMCAPTGRAAQRMSEVTGEEAKTIHRLLEVNWDKSDRPEFKKNEKNLLNCDALIVDEVSMVDVQLFESVMHALPLGCRLILVGDSHQLPSVGAGNVLDNLISSEKIPCVELNEIFRQSMESLIVTNAHKIVRGESPDLNAKDNDFFFLPARNMQVIEKTVVELVSARLPDAYGYDVYNDIQILSPGRKGDLGVNSLNAKLQSVINPKSDKKEEISSMGRILRAGDKVMQTKNNYDLSWSKDNGEFGEGIFNGEIGIIESISKKNRTIKVKFDDKTATYDFDFAPDLDLAYATTVHKSQGNEFEAVVIPMYRGAPQLLYRNLLYTAVTRAKKLLIIVGDESVLHQMINNDRKNRRYSGLRYFLQNIDETD